jgi:hypothetical protein
MTSYRDTPEDPRGFCVGPAGAADGARTLEDEAAQLEDFAAWLREKAAAGFELCEPVAGDYGWAAPGGVRARAWTDRRTA